MAEVVLIIGLIFLIIWVVKPLGRPRLDLSLRVLVGGLLLGSPWFHRDSPKRLGFGSITPSARRSPPPWVCSVRTAFAASPASFSPPIWRSRSAGRPAGISPAKAPQVLIVRDTRESGEMLEASLAAGIAAGGGHALLGGVLPTPAPLCWCGGTASISGSWCRRRTIRTATTASSSSGPRARRSPTTRSAGSRRSSRAPKSSPGRRSAGFGSCTVRPATTCARWSCASVTSTCRA